MRGRNDGSQSRRILVSVVASVFLLSVLSLYYGSFFNSRAHQSHASSGDDQFGNRDWHDIKENEVKTERDVDQTGEFAAREESNEEDQDWATKSRDTGRNDEEVDLKLIADERIEDGGFKGHGGMGELSLKTFPVSSRPA